MTSIKIRNIAIVDDHSLIREAIVRIVESEFKVVFQAENGKDFIEKFNTIKTKPELVLLDINMPEMGGLETLKWIRDNNLDLKVIMLTMYDSEEMIFKSVKLGANGYMLKNIQKDDLLKGINYVYNKNKGYYLDNEAIDKIIPFIKRLSIYEDPTEQIQRTLKNLPERDREIIQLMSRNLTDSEIGNKLNISRKTVEYFRYKLMNTLNIASRTELVNLISKAIL